MAKRYETRLLHKFTATDGRPSHAGSKARRWDIPSERADGSVIPGRWRTIRGIIQPCARGLHACTPEQLRLWVDRELYLIEVVDDTDALGHKTLIEHQGTKFVTRRARLIRRIAAWDDAANARWNATCFRAALTVATPMLAVDGGQEHPYLDIGRRLADLLDSFDGNEWKRPKGDGWVAIHDLQKEMRAAWRFRPDRDDPMVRARAFEPVLTDSFRLVDGFGWRSAYLTYVSYLRKVNGIAPSRDFLAIDHLVDPRVKAFFPDLIAADNAAHALGAVTHGAGGTPFDLEVLRDIAFPEGMTP